MGANIKTVEITLDKVRKLVFNLNTMLKFEEVTGKNFFDFSRNMSKMSALDLRAFLWAALVQDDPLLPIGVVGELINPENMENVQKSLLKAQSDNMPVSTDTEKKNT